MGRLCLLGSYHVAGYFEKGSRSGIHGLTLPQGHWRRNTSRYDQEGDIIWYLGSHRDLRDFGISIDGILFSKIPPREFRPLKPWFTGTRDDRNAKRRNSVPPCTRPRASPHWPHFISEKCRRIFREEPNSADLMISPLAYNIILFPRQFYNGRMIIEHWLFDMPAKPNTLIRFMDITFIIAVIVIICHRKTATLKTARTAKKQLRRRDARRQKNHRRLLHTSI